MGWTDRAGATSRASVLADLAFWSLAGTSVAVFSGPLSRQWDASRSVLIGLAAAIAAVGLLALLLLRAGRPIPRRIVQACGLGNLTIAPAAFAAATTGLLGLSTAGNWALTLVGVTVLTFGAWQLTSLRQARTQEAPNH